MSESPCKSTPRHQTVRCLPWDDDTRGDTKTEILKTVCKLDDGSPNGVPLKRVLNGVFEEWDPHDSKYMLAYRLPDQYPELLEKSKPYGDLLWFEPTDKAVSLLRSMQSVGKAEGGWGDALQQSALPQERAEQVLSSTDRITTDKQRGLLLKLLAYHKGTKYNQTGHKKFIGVGTPGTANRRRIQPNDRFTDTERAKRPRATYERLCEEVERRCDVATWATYTLPRECISSAYESVSVIRDGVNTLHDRFRYSPDHRPRPGYVPPHLTVLEPHMDLVAHLHVVYAGEKRLMDFHDLRQDWEEVLDAPSWKPPRIHLASLKVESETWRVKQSEGESNVAQTYGSIRDYHRDVLRRLAELADISREEIHTRADRLLEGDGTDKDRDLAGLTLLWATEARLTTASPSLRSK